MTSGPGWTSRWYVLQNISWVPASWLCRSSTPLSAPLVPTGTKAGVSITPCGVVIRPTRARDPGLRDRCSTSKRKKLRGSQAGKLDDGGGSSIGSAAAWYRPSSILTLARFGGLGATGPSDAAASLSAAACRPRLDDFNRYSAPVKSAYCFLYASSLSNKAAAAAASSDKRACRSSAPMEPIFCRSSAAVGSALLPSAVEHEGESDGPSAAVSTMLWQRRSRRRG
mmetsp:Transcript_36211/g.116270  ORF Transcript_36211/g.116270 Transcript_36211/m.116270 type:complete len:225 (+) Transcript_36211:1030-1704(+)